MEQRRRGKDEEGSERVREGERGERVREGKIGDGERGRENMYPLEVTLPFHEK